MAPTLFNIYFSMIIQVMEKRLAEIMKGMNKDHIGVKIMYDTNIQCWEQKKKTTGMNDIVTLERAQGTNGATRRIQICRFMIYGIIYLLMMQDW